MTDIDVLRDLGWVLAAATALLLVARRLHFPSLLAYILAGLVLGPLLGVLSGSESLEVFAELGVALLLFVVGMELGFDKIRSVGRVAVVGGLLQVGLSALVAGGLARAFGLPLAGAAIVGAAAAISSTVVVVKLLERAGELDALQGRLAIGILLVQDLVVAILLTLLGAVGSGGEGGLLAGAVTAFRGVGILALAGWVASRLLLPRLLAWMGRIQEGLFAVGLAWAFAFIIAAETLHVSIELGALIAGVALAQCPQNHELRRRVHPLVDLFLAVFFVGLGATIDPGAALRNLPLLAALTLFVVAVKPALIAGLLSALGQPRRESILAGITLGQVSEFSLILGAMAVANGLLDADTLSILGVLALVSIASSSLLAPAAPAFLDRAEGPGLAGRLLRLLPERRLPPEETTVRAGHVVVVGMNDLGLRLVDGLLARGHRVLAVDTDLGKLGRLPCDTLQGSIDEPAVFRAADATRALLVVSALQIEDTNRLLTYRCVEAGIPVGVHAFDPSLADEYLGQGADQVLVPKLDGVRLLEDALRSRGVLG